VKKILMEMKGIKLCEKGIKDFKGIKRFEKDLN
jgi:hypothetical protein